MTPKRIQRQRRKGWRMPEGAVYVGRRSRWGNPYVVGEDNPQNDGPSGPMSRETAVRNHYHDVTAPNAWAHFGIGWLAPLRGHDLACWCPLDQPCHADVLLELANR